MIVANVITDWIVGVLEEDDLCPAVAVSLISAGGGTMRDVTEQENVPGSPNGVIVELTCTAEQLAAAEAAGAYVLWSDEL